MNKLIFVFTIFLLFGSILVLSDAQSFFSQSVNNDNTSKLDNDSKHIQEPKFGDMSISISKLPNLGETAIVTVTNGDIEREQRLGLDTVSIGISISNQFEFVDLEPTHTNERDATYRIEMNISDKDSVSFSATIKAIGKGNGRVTGISDYNSLNTPAGIQMIISESETSVLGAIIDTQIMPPDHNDPEPTPKLPTPEELEQAKEEARIRNENSTQN